MTPKAWEAAAGIWTDIYDLGLRDRGWFDPSDLVCLLSLRKNLVFYLIPKENFLKEQCIHMSAPTIVARSRVVLRRVIKEKGCIPNSNCLPLLLFSL